MEENTPFAPDKSMEQLGTGDVLTPELRIAELAKLPSEQRIVALEELVIEGYGDVVQIAELIFKTLRGLGVTDFNNLENIGKTLMSKLPSLGMDMLFPQKMEKRFGHMKSAGPLLEKYKHLSPND